MSESEMDELRERNAELEQWCRAALEVIALGVELIPDEKLGQWAAVRSVIEGCPVKDASE